MLASASGPMTLRTSARQASAGYISLAIVAFTTAIYGSGRRFPMPEPAAPRRRRPRKAFGHPQILTVMSDRQQDACAARVNRESLNHVAGGNVKRDGAEPRAARHGEDLDRLAILVEHVKHAPTLTELRQVVGER